MKYHVKNRNVYVYLRRKHHIHKFLWEEKSTPPLKIMFLPVDEKTSLLHHRHRIEREQLYQRLTKTSAKENAAPSHILHLSQWLTLFTLFWLTMVSLTMYNACQQIIDNRLDAPVKVRRVK